MVDFKKLRAAKVKPADISPIKIFRRLPKPPGIPDLYTSQAKVLEDWDKRRDESDLVVKLHTGGGKTLVGLLIAQSILNECHEPVVYLSPTVQLVDQTLSKASEYGIPAVAYKKRSDFDDDFISGKSVLVCTYQALFSGTSRFGAPGSKRHPLNLGAIILDDAHVSFSTVRNSFTLKVERDKDVDGFETLTNLFRNDFDKIGRVGTFDDIVSGMDYNILEVPYWSWKSKSNQVREYLRKDADDRYPYVWPLLRDAFDYCHVLISKNSFVITPVFPLVDLIPSFANCPRRIFMSATIGDDSEIVRTFCASSDSISKPISSDTLAGISERMILAPELMDIKFENLQDTLKKIAKWATEKKDIGTVILVPSGYAATSWEDIASFANSTEKVASSIIKLLEGKTRGPFVFANRYDGIDLPGSTCRLLIMAGLPRGTSEYDQHRSNAFLGGNAINSALAQRIEQGMGRAARGAGDYCIVIVTGKDLIAWVGRSSNMNFLTSSTRAQLQMGTEVSRNVTNTKGLAETMGSCLNRDKEWIEYHAETLAESVELDHIDVAALNLANIEQKSLRLWRDGYFEKAIGKLEKYFQEGNGLDQQGKGWLFQFAARIAEYWGRSDVAQNYQEHAYACNRNLIRPQVSPPYVQLSKPGKQAEAIVSKVLSYFPRRGYIAEYDETVSHLVPEASANQFEQALEDFGNILGFSAERPENIYGIGPDVLWLLDDKLGLVIEAKSRKEEKNALTKKQHGQLLISTEWFNKQYPKYDYIRISIQPNIEATKNAIAEDTMVLTYERLNGLISEARELISKLCSGVGSEEELNFKCEKLLSDSKLKPNVIVKEFFIHFKLQKR